MIKLRRLFLSLGGVLALSLGADTYIDTGSYTVEQGESVEVRVSVSCPLLTDLNVWVAFDTAGLELVPGSLWINSDRLTNIYDESLTPVPDLFLVVPSADRVWFWLQRSAEVGDSGWRVSDHAPGSGADAAALFGFTVTGITRGTFTLTYPDDLYPTARNTSVFYPNEPVSASEGDVLVYLPPEPVAISPNGGFFNQAVEVALSSQYATAIYYTTDGSEPDASSTEYDGSFVLDGNDGESVTLRVHAAGGAGTSTTGSALFHFDTSAPTVSVNPLVTSDTQPVLTGLIDDPAASVAVTLQELTTNAVNHGDGTWSLDLETVLGEHLLPGIYDVGVVATDLAGNQGVDSTAEELVIDTTPPAGQFVISEGNPDYVSAAAVTLRVDVDGATEMRFRNAGADWGDWIAFADTYEWSLSEGDGSKTVYGEFRDEAQNLLSANDEVVLDSASPVSAIAIAGGYSPANWPGEINGSAADTLSGVAVVELQALRSDTGQYWNGAAWVDGPAWAVASGAASWGLGLPESALPENVTVQLQSRATDVAGNREQEPASSTFFYDASGPEGSFVIDAAASAAVSSTSVELRSSVSGADEMRFRNAGEAWSEWVPYAATMPWDLPSTDGTKTVYAEYRDTAGNVLALSDDIVLDTAAPVSTVSTAGGYGPSSWSDAVRGTAVDAGSGVTAVTVTVRRLPAGGEEEAYWTGSSWSSAEQSVSAAVSGETWSVLLTVEDLLPGGDGRTYSVTAQASDAAANQESTAAESTFLFDSRIPSGGFTIGELDPMYVNTQTVTLYNQVTSENPLEMRFRTDGGTFPPAWEPYVDTVGGVILSAGNGLKTMHGEFRDTVSGNTLATSDSVVLDLDDPTSDLTVSGLFGPLSWPGLITGTADDSGPAGVARVEVAMVRGDGMYWNGSDWQAEATVLEGVPSGGQWSVPLDVSVLSGGSSYFVTSQAVDRAGNVQSGSGSAVVTFDATAPTGGFTIGAGDPSSTNVREVTLSIAVSGAVEMAFRNEGGAWSAWVPFADSPAWTLTGGEGAKTVWGRFRDQVGNLLEGSDGIVFDSTEPTAELVLSSAYGPPSWPGMISGTAADNLSGVMTVEVTLRRVPDAAFWSGTAWGTSESWLQASGTEAWELALASDVFSSATSYEVSSRAVDHGGNVQTTSATATFLYDAGLPTSAPEMPGFVGPGTWPGALQGTAADSLTSVARVDVTLIRVLGGTIHHWDGDSWEPGFDSPWLRAVGTAAWSLPFGVTHLDDGAAYTVSSRAADEVGNVQSPAASSQFVFDASAPAAPVLTAIADDTGIAGDWITADRTLVLSGETDAAEDDLKVEVWFDGELVGETTAADGQWLFDYGAVPLVDGTIDVQLTAVDAAGNRSADSDVTTITVDTVAPDLTILSPPADTAVNGDDVVTFAVDEVNEPEASVNGEDWSAAESGVTLIGALTGFDALGQGPFVLRLRDHDAAGNEGVVEVRLLKDTISPAGYSIVLEEDWVFSGNHTAVHLTVSAAEPGTTCVYAFSDGDRAVVSGGFAVDFTTTTSPGIDLSTLSDGVLEVTAFLRDSAGNAGPDVTFQVQKDTTPPTGYAVAFSHSGINAGTVDAVFFAVTGGEAGAAYQFTIQSSGGGVPLTGSGTFSAATPEFGPLDASDLGDGRVTLVFQMTDSFGNTGQPASAGTQKDTIPPAEPAVNALTDPVTLANQQTVAFSGTTEASATILYEIGTAGSADQVTGSVAATAGGEFTASSVDVTALSDGVLTLRIRAQDAVGNSSDWILGATATKDTTPPDGYSAAFDDAFVNASESTLISFTLSAAFVGGQYRFEIRDESGSGPVVSGEGDVTASDQQVSGVDVAALGPGTLTLALRITDDVGNPGPEVIDTMLKGISQVVTLSRGWNLIGVTVQPAASIGAILAEAADRADGAVVQGLFHGRTAGETVRLVDGEALSFGYGYHVFCRKAGTLRIPGVPRDGMPDLMAGWSLVCPGSAVVVGELTGVDVVLRSYPRRGFYVRLSSANVVEKGMAVMVHVPEP